MKSRFVSGIGCLALAQVFATVPTEVVAHFDSPAPPVQPGPPSPAAPALSWIPLPTDGIPIPIESGPCDGFGEEDAVFFSHELTLPGRDALRVYFAECRLGQASYIRLTSGRDGGVQILDARAMRYWRGASAFFNGDAVLVELVVAPEDRDVSVQLAGVGGSGDGDGSPPPQPVTLCGNDNRGASTDARVCRIALNTNDPNNPLAWCTAWQVSNGAVLTAGHCIDSDPDGPGPMLPDGVVEANFLSGVVQFNVPASSCSGTPNHPPPADQYPVDAVTAFQFSGEGQSIGRDWAVFSILPNGGDAAHASRGWFRMTNELPAVGAAVRVTGFGTDSTPMGCSGDPNFPQNAQSQTNQTSTGPFVGETVTPNAISLQHAVDTEGGNSGSPIIWEAQGITIGIHTAGGCTSEGGANNGTSFELDALENALASFPGPNCRFVDAAFPLSVTRDGTIFRPWSSFLTGVLGVPTGGTLVIVPGTYHQTLTISKAMTIVAPAGTATIGP